MLPVEPAQIAPRFQKKHDKSVQHTRFGCAFHTVDLAHPDAPALDVLASIVGSGESSILSQKFQDKLRLVHSIGAISYTPKTPGLFSVSAWFDPDKEEVFLEKLYEEIAFWHNRPFSDKDLDKAKRSVLTSELSNHTTMDGQASAYATGEFYAADPYFSETYIKLLNEVTSRQLNEVAAKYLRPEKCTTVLLAPPEKEKEDTAVLATVPGTPALHKLQNDLRLIVRRDSKLPFVYGTIVLRGGLLAENENNSGISHMLSELLVKGTSKRSAFEIAEMIESLGGSLAPFSGQNSLGLNFKCLTEDAEKFIELAAECLLSPSFPQVEIEKQKVIQTATLVSQGESPVYVAMQKMREMLFPGHPYSFDLLGTEQSVKSISREDLMQFHRKTVLTDNLVVSLSGDMNDKEAKKLVSQYFAKIPTGAVAVPEQKLPKKDLQKSATVMLPKEQAVYIIGFTGIDMKNPHQPALAILKEAMNGLSSRLMTEIREERGLAYYAGTLMQLGIDPGYFAVYAGTRPDAMEEVGNLLKAEIARVCEIGLETDEFERARASMLSTYSHSLQSNATMAMSSAVFELYGLGYLYPFQEPDRIKAVTIPDVRKAAQEILRMEDSVTSMVIPIPEQKENDDE